MKHNLCSYCNERFLLKRKNAQTCGDIKCIQLYKLALNKKHSILNWPKYKEIRKQRRLSPEYRERERETRNRWHKNNSDKINQRRRERYRTNEEHREKLQSDSKLFYKNNSEKLKKKRKEYYYLNHEKLLNISKEYYHKKKESKPLDDSKEIKENLKRKIKREREEAREQREKSSLIFETVTNLPFGSSNK